MLYRLNELLTKMGAPEVREKNHVRWHYFDKKNNRLGGYAEIRLEADGQMLVAELHQYKENYEDDEGCVHSEYEETFYLKAVRDKNPLYFKILEVSFDGIEYHLPQKPFIELGLSIFHARALDISIMMVEQAFNKQDILEPVIDKGFQYPKNFSAKKQESATIIPFRPRTARVH